MKPEIPKTYNAKEMEDKIYRTWAKSGFFNPDKLPGQRPKSFSISMPPPNATGVLHLGHSVMLAIQDLVIRFQRMSGKKTLWLPGTDHAAIATQTKVEKLLKEKEGKNRHNLGREEFLKRVEQYVKDSQGTIRNQIRKMGSSCDWSRERYTMDEGLTQAVQEAFVRMYQDGLIYRGDRIVNWCPRCGSTLADDEVEYLTQKAKFYYIKYGPLVIATTRPETKLGDTAAAVNPRDKRYQKYVGKGFDVDLGKVKIHIKVIAEPAVNPAFGTGVVGVTPAHSAVDFEMAQKNKLPVIQVIGPDGKMTKAAGPYVGLTVEDCRKKLVVDLQVAGLIQKIEEIENNLSICYRCENIIEPLISKQWFINVNKSIKKFGDKSIKNKALEVVKKGEIEIIPERFKKVYYHWLENLRDWCISRQIWFGHRLPVTYCGGTEKADQPKMGFHQDVVPQVFKGKSKTYRLRDHGFKVGDKVLFENSQTNILFGYGIITEVEEIAVEKINYKDKTHFKTYKNLKELIAVFKLRNPDKIVTPESKAYLYAYEFHPFTKEDAKIGCGQIIVSNRTPEKCPACGGKNLQRDPDTLDTWFSSGLWTFSTLGWPASAPTSPRLRWARQATAGKPRKTGDLKVFHPTSLMETGYDILFFWVARMIIMSTYLMEEIPFKQVYLHGLIRDKEGRKMSKSLGNVIDPLDMIEKFGADAVRLSLLLGTTPGNDVNLYEEKIASYRNFVNKLWNISRYILMTVKKPRLVEKMPKAKTLADRWILAKFSNLVHIITEDLNNYRFSAAGELLYEFTWSELADWYLEISKIEKDKNEILLFILQELLKLWHPFCPFVTEVIWKNLSTEKLLIIQEWPETKWKKELGKLYFNKMGVFTEFKFIQELTVEIRNLRAEKKIPPAQKIRAVIISKDLKTLIKKEAEVIKGLSGLSGLEVLSKGKKPQNSFGAVLPSVEIYLPISGIMDIDLEKRKLEKEIKEVGDYIIGIKEKFKNQNFIQKAPKEIIEKEKEKLAQQQEKLEKLKKQLAELK